jgi:hypothetical protein
MAAQVPFAVGDGGKSGHAHGSIKLDYLDAGYKYE